MNEQQNENSAASGRSDSKALLAAANFTTDTGEDDCELCKFVRMVDGGMEPSQCAKHGVHLEANGICDAFEYFDDEIGEAAPVHRAAMTAEEALWDRIHAMEKVLSYVGECAGVEPGDVDGLIDWADSHRVKSS
jgi:hypothetical protein